MDDVVMFSAKWWTLPLGQTWMAWTPATVSFFLFIVLAISAMGVWEDYRPGGDPRRVTILLDPAVNADQTELKQKMRSIFPSRPGHIRMLADSDTGTLTDSVRAESPGMLVLSANGESTSPNFLADLRKSLRCPICLVRFWEEKGSG